MLISPLAVSTSSYWPPYSVLPAEVALIDCRSNGGRGGRRAHRGRSRPCPLGSGASPRQRAHAGQHVPPKSLRSCWRRRRRTKQSLLPPRQRVYALHGGRSNLARHTGTSWRRVFPAHACRSSVLVISTCRRFFAPTFHLVLRCRPRRYPDSRRHGRRRRGARAKVFHVDRTYFVLNGTSAANKVCTNAPSRRATARLTATIINPSITAR